MRILILILIFCFFSTAAAENKKFISIADIHFDPFFDCEKKPCPLIVELKAANYTRWESILEKHSSHKMAGVGDDTNFTLLKVVLQQIKEASKEIKPTFVLVLGDSLAHRYPHKYVQFSGDKKKTEYRNFVKKTFQFLAYELKNTFPDVDVYQAIGNNDSYTGNYHSVPQGAFFNDLADISSVLIHDPKNHAIFLQEFPVGGYYTITLPGPDKLKVIILNTTYFSTKARGHGVADAAKQELNWFHKQLALSANQKQKVIVAFHIPVSFNMIVPKLFWKNAYIQQFSHDLIQFPNVVTALLPAHIHFDANQTMEVGDYSLPVLFTPAISPIFGNSIALKVFTYDSETFKIVSYQTVSIT